MTALSGGLETGGAVEPLSSEVVGVNSELDPGAAERVGGVVEDHCERCGCDPTLLVLVIDGKVEKLTNVVVICECNHTDDAEIVVADGERSPSPSVRTYVALGQNHQCDRLMIGDETKLVVGNGDGNGGPPVRPVDLRK